MEPRLAPATYGPFRLHAAPARSCMPRPSASLAKWVEPTSALPRGARRCRTAGASPWGTAVHPPPTRPISPTGQLLTPFTPADHPAGGLAVWVAFSPVQGSPSTPASAAAHQVGMVTNLRGHPDEQLESVLGATPHEFESRILRRSEGPHCSPVRALCISGLSSGLSCDVEPELGRAAGETRRDSGQRLVQPPQQARRSA